MSRNRGNWNGILKMNEEDDDPMINMDNIEDDDDQLLNLENSLREYAKANVYVFVVVITDFSKCLYLILFRFRGARSKKDSTTNSFCFNSYNNRNYYANTGTHRMKLKPGLLISDLRGFMPGFLM